MDLLDKLEATVADRLGTGQPFTVRGHVVEVLGTLIRAVIPEARIGEICLLRSPEDGAEFPAEVVGFSKESAVLTPLGRIQGVSTNMEVLPTGRVHEVACGDWLLGRVLDGLGHPLDADEKGKPPPAEVFYPVYADPPHPLARGIIEHPLPLGVRALDGLLTVGEGQRIGIFAAAGGGKSTLLASIIRGAEVDVNVVALIGERGREVREFIELQLGPEGLARTVLVVSTSDRPAMERLKASYVATAIAEYFRDRGRKVMLMMDSVTRFARAQREIGLAAGEPPTRRGFPPSVFSALPVLLERAGPGRKGSITGIYTVLVEGDDMTEPVADETRSILDGHVILSRKLAAANHYPAIDVLGSVSRVMDAIVTPDHRGLAGRLRELYAKYNEVELLVQLGEYKAGTDPLADQAIAKIGAIKAFLRQDTRERMPFAACLARLKEVLA
jgi:type III secretion protein N (ATPase)